MAAKLEIEVIDRGTPQQQGAAGGGVPMGTTGAVPGQLPPGHSQFPPGSVGDVAHRWQQTGAMNSVAGSVPGVDAPVVSQLGSTVQPSTVEESAQEFEVTGKPAKLGWKHGQPDSPSIALDEVMQYNEKGERKKKAGEKDDSAGLDRLLWQGGFGKLGNLAAQVDSLASMPENASQFRRGAGMAGVASAAAGVVGGVGDAFAGGVRGAGSLAASIASNDTDTINKVVDGMEGLARKVPIVGEALGGTLAAIAAPGRALQEVFGALVNRGKEIGQYSGAISQAQAMQDVTTVLADIREAQNNEEGYAALIQAQTEFNSNWREAFEPVRKVLVEELVAFMSDNKEYLKTAMQVIAKDVAMLTRLVASAMRAFPSAIQTVFRNTPMAQMVDTMMAAFEAQVEMNERDKKKDTPQSTLTHLYTLLGGMDPALQPPPGG